MVGTRVYHPCHGDTSLMVVMAPFRDELSHGQWFRETPSFTEAGRVKSSLRLAQDRAQWNCRSRSLSLSLSPPEFGFKSGSWNMQRTITVVYQFHRARKSRDSSPSLQRVVPYHRGRLHAYPRRCLSLYIFDYIPSFASFHSHSVYVGKRSGEGCTVSPLTDTRRTMERGGRRGEKVDRRKMMLG